MRKWTTRVEGFVRRTGATLHQADAKIDADMFLHPLILGILFLECSQLTPAENAAVLATSRATTKEGITVGNSHLSKDLVASFRAQWDEATPRRDKSSSHRRAGHLATAESSWEQAGPTFCEDGEHVTDDEWMRRLGGTILISENGRSTCHVLPLERRL